MRESAAGDETQPDDAKRTQPSRMSRRGESWLSLMARGHHWEHYCGKGTEAGPEVISRWRMRSCSRRTPARSCSSGRPTSPTARSRREAVRSRRWINAGQSLEEVLGRIGLIVKGLVSELRASADWPDEVEVEFEFAVRIFADSKLVSHAPAARRTSGSRFGGVSRGADDGSQRVRRPPVAHRS